MFMVTYTGRVVDPCNLQIEDVDIQDIAHSLSMQCRFAGHTREFYSVAQHSIRVSELVLPEHALHALLHDATEAYVQDIIRPVKYEPKMRGYLVLEERVWIVVAQHFGIGIDHLPCVELADKRVLKAEIEQFTKVPHDKYHEWMHGIEAAPRVDTGMPPHTAKAAFMARFEELAGKGVKDVRRI